jgi:CheY-like chemotaxis protein
VSTPERGMGRRVAPSRCRYGLAAAIIVIHVTKVKPEIADMTNNCAVRLTLDLDPGRDTFLPPHATTDRLSESSNSGPGRRLGVLVVEDEDGLRRAIGRLLQEAGYLVLQAQHGAAALELLAGSPAARVNLVLTDLRMPVMDGRQLAAALARSHPSLPIIFMSGFTAQMMDLRLVSPHLAFLAKPFRNEELLAAIRSHLGPPI